MSSGKVLLGILAGVAVGSTLGILFAPDKGTSTRKRIIKKGEGYVDELDSKYNDILRGMNKRYEALKEEMAMMTKKGKSKMEEAESQLATVTNGKKE